MLKKLITACIISVMMLCFASSVFSQVAFHGFVQTQINIESDAYTARIPRYGLRIMQTVDDEFAWLSEFYIHPTITAAAGRLYMESAWIDWYVNERFSLPWDFKIRFGKGRNETYGQAPYYSRRRTSDYSLYSESFTQLRVVGLQTFSNFGPVQLAIGILNPNLINVPPRDVPGFAGGTKLLIPISDRDNNQSTTQRVALSGRLGYKTEMLNVGGSLYLSETGKKGEQLDLADPTNTIEGKNAQTRFGADGEFKHDSGILVQGQFTMAKTAMDMDPTFPDPANPTVVVYDGVRETEIDQMGFEILGGWESDKLGLYARYGMLSYDDEMQGMNQIMLSAIYKIRPAIHLRLEANINGEDEDAAKGWAEVNNNRLFFETLFAF